MAEINLTPLIDVLLVLLIIFMVAVPIMQRNLEVSVPETPKPGATPPVPAPALPMIDVRADLFRLDQEVYSSADELEKGLNSRLATRRDRAVIVRAGGTVDYGRVVAAMDAARGAGATQIGVLPADEGSAK
jgi:biopolymer transport protein TolR